jgi:hypothetical protein
VQLDITNYPGTPADRTLDSAQLPPYLFPAGALSCAVLSSHPCISSHASSSIVPDATHFINDLESTCYGLKSLNESDQLASFFKPLWSTTGQVVMKRTNCTVARTHAHDAPPRMLT